MRKHCVLVIALSLLFSALPGHGIGVPRKLLEADLLPPTRGTMTPVGLHRARELHGLVDGALNLGAFVGINLDLGALVFLDLGLPILDLVALLDLDIDIDVCLAAEINANVAASLLCTKGYDCHPGTVISTSIEATIQDCQKKCLGCALCEQLVYKLDKTCILLTSDGDTGTMAPDSGVDQSCVLRAFVDVQVGQELIGGVLKVLTGITKWADCMSAAAMHPYCGGANWYTDNTCALIAVDIHAGLPFKPNSQVQKCARQVHQHRAKPGRSTGGTTIKAIANVDTALTCKATCCATGGCSGCTYDKSKTCTMFNLASGPSAAADANIEIGSQKGAFCGACYHSSIAAGEGCGIPDKKNQRCCGKQGGSSCAPAGTVDTNLHAWFAIGDGISAIVKLEVFRALDVLVALRLTNDKDQVFVVGDIGAAIGTAVALDIRKDIDLLTAGTVYLKADASAIAGLSLEIGGKTFECLGSSYSIPPGGSASIPTGVTPVSLDVPSAGGVLCGCSGTHGNPSGSSTLIEALISLCLHVKL